MRSSLAVSRAISTKSAPSTAHIRQQCSAMPEVAPITTIFMAVLSQKPISRRDMPELMPGSRNAVKAARLGVLAW